MVIVYLKSTKPFVTYPKADGWVWADKTLSITGSDETRKEVKLATIATDDVLRVVREGVEQVS